MTELGLVDLEGLTSQHIPAEKLNAYFSCLMEQNRRVNLVSRETNRAGFERMVGESLLPLKYMKIPVQSYLDIGAGGGIPAIPFLLAGAVSGKTTLFERTLKKARALETIVDKLQLKASVIARNFEELDGLPRVELITLRYVKLTPVLLHSIGAVLCPGGLLVYYGPPLDNNLDLRVERFTFQSVQDSVVKSFTIFQK